DDIDEVAPQADTLNVDLRRVAEIALDKLRNQAAAVDTERTAVQEEIDAKGGEIRALETRIETLDALFNVSQSAGQEATTGLGELQQERDLVASKAEELCPFGKVKLKDCVHVKDRQAL